MTTIPATTRNLLEAVTNCGLDKFIFSSTAAVYGEPMTTGPIREDAVLNPMSPYGSSKLMTEIMVRDTALASNLALCDVALFQCCRM